MVTFECQACNETVKKPKVAKHLQMCGSAFVSCIDCSQVFRWDEYEAHTKCISEAQKYQGKLFEAKQSENKGQLKQDNWIANVEKLIEEPSTKISPQTKSSLQKLLGFTNIPRKQKPFTNFAKNSINMWHNDKLIHEMWELISLANAKKPAEVAPVKEEPPKWQGWKRALDDELKSAGVALPWKRLRDSLVTKYKTSGEATLGKSDEDLGCEALASIPVEYLSSEDPNVRLP